MSGSATPPARLGAHVIILPPDVANKIAAGEVVDRPASVVKELVENALDAGATRITIEIEGGGRTLMRISDDGAGMSRADAELAIQRHATSKIHTVDDIDAITTLGFRGEALPSIASVAHFELVTCQPGAAHATRITIDGGHDVQVSDAARAPGTTVAVRTLFYCVPARAKFLKTTATEISHIARVVHAVMLAQPHVGFKYLLENTVQYDVPPQPPGTPFADALRTRLSHVRGHELVNDLLPIDYQAEPFTVRGFCSTWSRAVLSRQELFLYVNRRPVRCAWLAALIKRAYGTLLSTDAYPYAFLFVDVPPRAVDVNMHPAKLEVRFGNEYAVQSAISNAIMACLQAQATMPRVGVAARTTAAAGASDAPDTTRLSTPPVLAAPWSRKLSIDEWKKLYGRAPDAAAPALPAAGAAPGVAAPTPAAADTLRVLGQAGNKYIVAEIAGARNGIVLIDQHAAHERVGFDELTAAMATRSVAQQALLLPATAQVSAMHAAVLHEQLDALRTMGFAIEEFGPDTFKIDAVPAFVNVADVASLLSDIAAELLELGRTARVEELHRRMLLLLICKGSITFNQPLSLPEMQALVNRLRTTATPWTCPHGRPTMIVIPYDELEKRFGRRG
ncbi:MAG: DNA mismatch repair endonuclease MutL [bacterium]|nr:DNA mismatch repair endonuclease MutL [bacterium]